MPDFPLFLESLKRPAWLRVDRAIGTASGNVFFQISFCGDTPEVRVVTETGDPAVVDYRLHTGALREALKRYSRAQEQSASTFQWGGPGDADGLGVSFEQAGSQLLRLLAVCGNVVDERMQPIGYSTITMNLALTLSEDGSEGVGFDARLELRSATGRRVPLSEPRMLTDGFLLDGQTIHEYTLIGSGYPLAPRFIERIPVNQLNTYLSLFASTFPGVEIDYPDHGCEYGDPIAARPALIIEEVDKESTLHFAVADEVGDLPIEFTRDYDIGRFAFLDQSTGAIRVREVSYANAMAARASLIADLVHLNRKHKSETAFFKDTEDGRYLLGADLARVFLTEHLAKLIADFTLYGADKLRQYRVVYAKPNLHMRLRHGIDFLEGDGDLEIAGERISLIDAIKQYQQNHYIQLSSGEQAVLDPRFMARVSRLVKTRKGSLSVSFFDLPIIEELLASSTAAAESLPPSREVFRGFSGLESRRVPLRRFKGQLRPYQRAGLQWLDYLHEHKLGGCLADDMGLGKTVQTIALLSRVYPREEKPTLIVMPRSLLFNWSRELDTFAPEVSYHVHYGTGRDWLASSSSSVILTTYGTLRSDIETIGQTEFHAVLLDESQAIKNEGTQTALAAFALKAQFRLALSGTPIENHLGELYSLFRFLNPGMFRNRAEFDRDYAQPIQQGNQADAAEELRRKIRPFVLRRLKSEVLKDLPPKVEQVLYVEMGDEQKAHYENRRRFHKQVIRGEIERLGIAKSQFAVLEALLELRQIASVPESKTDGEIPSAKREVLANALSEAIENGHKCLIFSNFLAGVEQACEVLTERSILHLRMTGTTTDRGELVERFQNDSRIKAFVMTLKTGGLGLNLTAADTVFILDPWWNTSAESQAVDRAHRMGQNQTVFTYRLIARGTIEERILELQRRKKDLVDKVVASDATILKGLSEEDIDLLFNG